MSGWTFVHASDLHLDSPLRGLSRYEGAPIERMRAATRTALESLVSLCIDEQVRFLVLAGDIYDGDWKDFATGLFFRRQMSRLDKAKIPVYLVHGNHDARSIITRELSLPDNVHTFGTRRAETFIIDGVDVAIHGRSYSTRSVIENVAQGYPEPVAGHLNLGILHTSLGGHAGHDEYAPCTVDELRRKRYDYWALGHVHEAAFVATDPWIVWSGTTQGRHARECGARGCMLVRVDDEGIDSVEFRATDVIRWHRITCDVSPCSRAEELLPLLRHELEAALANSDGRPLAVRVEIEGATAAHDAFVTQPERWHSEIRALAEDLEPAVWVEKIRFATHSRVDVAALARREDAIGGLVRRMASYRDDATHRSDLVLVLSELRDKLPGELLDDHSDASLFGEEAVTTLLEEAEHLLVSRLLHGQDPGRG